MLSRRMLKIICSRQRFTDISRCAAFNICQPVGDRVRLGVSKWQNFLVYVFFTLLTLTYCTISMSRMYLRIWETKINRTQFVVDIDLGVLVSLSAALILLVAMRRKEHVKIFNVLMSLDEGMRKGSQNVVLKSLMVTKYREKLQLQMVVTESLLILISVTTAVIPVLHGFVLLDKVDPINRFLRDVFHIRLRAEWKYFPLMGCITYFVLQVRNVCIYLRMLLTSQYFMYLENYKHGNITCEVLWISLKFA